MMLIQVQDQDSLKCEMLLCIGGCQGWRDQYDSIIIMLACDHLIVSHIRKSRQGPIDEDTSNMSKHEALMGNQYSAAIRYYNFTHRPSHMEIQRFINFLSPRSPHSIEVNFESSIMKGLPDCPSLGTVLAWRPGAQCALKNTFKMKQHIGPVIFEHLSHQLNVHVLNVDLLSLWYLH